MDHRIERAWEHYGVAITRADIERMRGEIAAGRAQGLRKAHDGSATYFVRHGELWFIAVMKAFDDDTRGPRHEIVTFLAPDSFKAGRRVDWARVNAGKAGKVKGRMREARLRDRFALREALSDIWNQEGAPGVA